MRKVNLTRIVILSFLCLCTGNAAAQSLQYDPLLDPACKEIPERETEIWTHTYMWYPGQLASHMQKQLKQISKDRCVNVGYPGKFNKDAGVSYFRKQAKVKFPTLLRWNAPSRVVCSVNGKKLDEATREQTLEKGEYDLCFEVRTSGRLPALILKGEGIEELRGWEVSLDGIAWNKPETSPRYNQPAKFPDDPYETTVRIQPYEWIPVRNSKKEGSKLIVGKNGYALIDFRHLEVGTVELEVKGKGALSLRVGESPEEALNTNERLFEQYAIPSFELDGSVQTVRLPQRALRYLALESSELCEIRSAYFDAAIWPVTYQMKFESSDEGLNNLWNAAGATLHTSMHNFYLDGVKRDYLPWSMDAIASAFAGDYLFADLQVSHNGLSVAMMPPNPEASDLGIIDYPLHALVGFKQDYLRYGNLNTSRLYKDRIIQMLAFYETIQDERGFISSVHSTSGFVPGWATKDGPSGRGIPAYGQMMLYLNFLTGSYFADLWKEKKLAGHYRKKAGALKKSILNHFWDADRKAFINGYGLDGKTDTRISHHAQYWGILTDLFPPEDYAHLFDEVLPSIPHYKKDISYEKGYEFLAYAKAGRVKDMCVLLEEIWGDWLAQGHTRFPENFSPQASRQVQLEFYKRPFGLSLCHGANGVPPVIAVLRGILGFDQSETQINTYYLNPNLLHLEWVKGEIPLKEGVLKYEITQKGESTIEIPEGCVVHIGKKQGKKPLRTFKRAGVYRLE